MHNIHSSGLPVTIVFERDATHLYSREVKQEDEPVPPYLLVVRAISPQKTERRIFDLERARLMDHILPAITQCTTVVQGQGARGREKILIHGPRLGTGDYMRVVLRPGPGKAWTCVSAYTVNVQAWLQARQAKRLQWPQKNGPGDV